MFFRHTHQAETTASFFIFKINLRTIRLELWDEEETARESKLTTLGIHSLVDTCLSLYGSPRLEKNMNYSVQGTTQHTNCKIEVGSWNISLSL